MQKKFEYKFDDSLGILIKTYYGLITIEDIESSWRYAFENGLIPEKKKGFILDYRKSNFDIEIDEHTLIADFYRKHIDVFGNYKIAIITENPKDIVVPMLVESLDRGYYSKPFSTFDAAVDWVLN
ncbi:hypothetical protein ACFQ0R_08640 [Psychroflexus salinarum]|uniref:SpoIIAA-like n=1 Tax=Psychroflexus salinarum TaxID=546024 RepID=A0ABW3GQ55_9FLAO